MSRATRRSTSKKSRRTGLTRTASTDVSSRRSATAACASARAARVSRTQAEAGAAAAVVVAVLEAAAKTPRTSLTRRLQVMGARVPPKGKEEREMQLQSAAARVMAEAMGGEQEALGEEGADLTAAISAPQSRQMVRMPRVPAMWRASAP